MADEVIPIQEDTVTRLGLQDSYKIGLADTVRAGFAQADTLLFGDTGHEYYQQITGALGAQDVQIAIAESAATRIFLELPEYRQSLVNQFQERAANPDIEPRVDVFADRFQYEADTEAKIEEWTFFVEEKTQDYLQNYVAPMLDRAAQLGVEVRLLDQGNGLNEKGKALDLEGRFFETLDERARVREEQDVNDPRVQQRLDKLDIRYSELRDATEEAIRLYYDARHDDRNLAQIVNNEADGEKSAILFGGVHGSRYNDFEEHLQGRSLKIDIALSRENYEGEYAAEIMRMRKFDIRFGEDPADLVYFLDEGVVSTTVNTPSDVVQAIEALAQPVAVSPVVDQAQENALPSVSPVVKP